MLSNGISCQIVLPKPNTFTSSPTQGPPSNKSQTSATKAAAPTKKFRRVKKRKPLFSRPGDGWRALLEPPPAKCVDFPRNSSPKIRSPAPDANCTLKKIWMPRSFGQESFFQIDKLGKLKVYLDPLPPNFWLIIGRKKRKSGDKTLYFPRTFSATAVDISCSI